MPQSLEDVRLNDTENSAKLKNQQHHNKPFSFLLCYFIFKSFQQGYHVEFYHIDDLSNFLYTQNFSH